MNNGTTILFDGNSLQTDNIITNDIDHFSGPNKNAPIYAVGHGNRSAIPWVGWPSKTITITGTLLSDSIADMDALIDTFKGYFIGKDKFLDIGYNGSTRRYTCTPEQPVITRPGGLTYATFSIVFDCTVPFGQNTSPTTALSQTGRTLGIYADSHTFVGNAPFQYVIATFTYTAITGGTNKTVTFGNNANSQGISITRNWAANDTLQIDTFNKLVTVNGAVVPFTGAFPEFPPGGQAMGYSDGLTTRTFNVNIVYYPAWL